MKTVVLQSFRTHGVPRWVAASMDSVRAWADMQGWDYAFMDDAFFALAQPWARQRCGDNIYALTDICRLEWAKAKLAQGYQRVLWADADVLVFAPQQLSVPPGQGHGFARELFLHVDERGRSTPLHGINNALMAFEAGDAVLAAYLQECYAALRALPPGPVPRTALGPALLAKLADKLPLRLIEHVGLFSYAVMESIAAGGGPIAQEYLRQSPTPPAAANLCHFLRNATPPDKRAAFDRMYDAAVAKLMASQGSVLSGLPANGL